MYNTTEAVKAALGQSVVRMRLLSESVSLLASDAKPIQSSDGKPIWVFAVGPFPDGKVDGEQLSSLSYNAGCCDGDIGIGNVSSASLSGSIHGVLNLLNVSFTAQVGVDVNGKTQWMNLGKFTVTECTRTDDSTTFTAYDAAYTAFGQTYTPAVLSGSTGRAILEDISRQTGIEVEPPTLAMCTMQTDGALTGHTYREMVGYIAALCGKNAVITRDGFLRFVFVELTEQTVTADDYYSGAMSNWGISKLWGLSCAVPGQEEEQTLTVGDAEKAVTVSCPYMTQAQLERVWYDIGGYEYPVGNVSFYRGLLTEPGDVVSLTNLAGVTISFPAMQVNLEIDGGCRCTISSFGKSDAVRISGTAGPTEKRLQSVQLAASRAMTSANGKNKVFHQASAPAASEGLTAGDLWFNTALGNQIATWDGNQWSAFRLQDAAVSNLDAGAITSGKLAAQYINVEDLFAQNITATNSFQINTDKLKLLADSSGVTISSGRTTNIYTKFTSDAFDINYGDINIAHFGFGPTIDSSGKTVMSRYYTLGSRNIHSTIGYCSFAMGSGVIASGSNSFAEGQVTTASGQDSHSEGASTTASGWVSHAEGWNSEATSTASHAEGWDTQSNSLASHAEGESTIASGLRAHAGGYGTIAASENQTAIGRYNIQDSSDTYAFIIGNGTDENNRSNAFTVDWNGKVGVRGKITGLANGTDDSDAVNKRQLDSLNITSVTRVAKTVTTGATGNIITDYANDGTTYVIAPLVSGRAAFLRAWVSSANGYWYLTAVDPNTGATIKNAKLAIRYLVVKIKNM